MVIPDEHYTSGLNQSESYHSVWVLGSNYWNKIICSKIEVRVDLLDTYNCRLSSLSRGGPNIVLRSEVCWVQANIDIDLTVSNDTLQLPAIFAV